MDKPQKIIIECYDDGTFDFDVDGEKMIFKPGVFEYRTLDDICRRLYKVKIYALMKKDGG